MNCKKCGCKMEMHYVEFCPKCDKPEDNSVRVIDYFRTAYYIAAQEGYDYNTSNHNNWLRTVLLQMEFPGNDCYISIGWEDEEYEDEYDPELWQYYMGLKKHFNVNGQDEILLNISW